MSESELDKLWKHFNFENKQVTFSRLDSKTHPNVLFSDIIIKIKAESDRLQELEKKLEAIDNLKKGIDASIDFIERTSRTHGIHNDVKVRLKTQKEISEKLSNILGVEE